MKLLMVTYSYDTSPLHILTGSQRVFSFAKYLPSYDIEIAILSFRDSLRGARQTGKFGERIYRVLDLLCVIERFFIFIKKAFAGAYSPKRKATTSTQKRRSTLLHVRLFYIPPGRQIVWAVCAFCIARRLHKTEGFDVVLTTSPYEATHWIGWLLKKWERIPWIADMRDGWMFEPYRLIRRIKGFRQRIEIAMEKFLLSRADSITTATKPLADDFITRLSIPENNVFYIPNGFDSNEWGIQKKNSVKKARAQLKDTGHKMLMVHMGRLSAARIDIDVNPFFQALQKLKALNPSFSQLLSVYLVGTTRGPELDMVRGLDLGDVVQFIPAVKKQEAIALMKEADALLLFTSLSEKSVATSKLFDYMAAGKPVLALAQGNAAADIVSQTDIGLTVSPVDVLEIADALQKFLIWWKQEEFPFRPKQDQIKAYSRDKQAAKMAWALKRVVTKRCA